MEVFKRRASEEDEQPPIGEVIDSRLTNDGEFREYTLRMPDGTLDGYTLLLRGLGVIFTSEGVAERSRHENH